MPRRLLCILALAVFLASATGLSLNLHQQLEGSDHNAQRCSICHDFVDTSKALVGTPAAIQPTGHTPVVALGTESQRVSIVLFGSLTAPRAPPTA